MKYIRQRKNRNFKSTQKTPSLPMVYPFRSKDLETQNKFGFQHAKYLFSWGLFLHKMKKKVARRDANVTPWTWPQKYIDWRVVLGTNASSEEFQPNVWSILTLFCRTLIYHENHSIVCVHSVAYKIKVKNIQFNERVRAFPHFCSYLPSDHLSITEWLAQAYWWLCIITTLGMGGEGG